MAAAYIRKEEKAIIDQGGAGQNGLAWVAILLVAVPSEHLLKFGRKIQYIMIGGACQSPEA